MQHRPVELLTTCSFRSRPSCSHGAPPVLGPLSSSRCKNNASPEHDGSSRFLGQKTDGAKAILSSHNMEDDVIKMNGVGSRRHSQDIPGGLPALRADRTAEQLAENNKMPTSIAIHMIQRENSPCTGENNEDVTDTKVAVNQARTEDLQVTSPSVIAACMRRFRKQPPMSRQERDEHRQQQERLAAKSRAADNELLGTKEEDFWWIRPPQAASVCRGLREVESSRHGFYVSEKIEGRSSVQTTEVQDLEKEADVLLRRSQELLGSTPSFSSSSSSSPPLSAAALVMEDDLVLPSWQSNAGEAGYPDCGRQGVEASARGGEGAIAQIDPSTSVGLAAQDDLLVEHGQASSPPALPFLSRNVGGRPLSPPLVSPLPASTPRVQEGEVVRPPSPRPPTLSISIDSIEAIQEETLPTFYRQQVQAMDALERRRALRRAWRSRAPLAGAGGAAVGPGMRLQPQGTRSGPMERTEQTLWLASASAPSATVCQPALDKDLTSHRPGGACGGGRGCCDNKEGCDILVTSLPMSYSPPSSPPPPLFPSFSSGWRDRLPGSIHLASYPAHSSCLPASHRQHLSNEAMRLVKHLAGEVVHTRLFASPHPLLSPQADPPHVVGQRVRGALREMETDGGDEEKKKGTDMTEDEGGQEEKDEGASNRGGKQDNFYRHTAPSSSESVDSLALEEEGEASLWWDVEDEATCGEGMGEEVSEYRDDAIVQALVARRRELLLELSLGERGRLA